MNIGSSGSGGGGGGSTSSGVIGRRGVRRVETEAIRFRVFEISSFVVEEESGYNGNKEGGEEREGDGNGNEFF